MIKQAQQQRLLSRLSDKAHAATEIHTVATNEYIEARRHFLEAHAALNAATKRCNVLFGRMVAVAKFDTTGKGGE